MRYLIAAVLFVAALVSGLLGIGDRTIWAPPASHKISVSLDTTAPYVVVPAKVLKNAPPITGREVELVWNLHGSMFYWAVRQHIFGAKPAGTSFEERTADAVDLFLAGAQVQYPVIVAEEVKALQDKAG